MNAEQALKVAREALELASSAHGTVLMAAKAAATGVDATWTRTPPPPGCEEYDVVDRGGKLLWLKREDLQPGDTIGCRDGDKREIGFPYAAPAAEITTLHVSQLSSIGSGPGHITAGDLATTSIRFCHGGQPIAEYVPVPLDWTDQAEPCNICAGTKTTFGKRCVCANKE